MIDALVQMIADQVGTRGAEILGVFLRVGAVVALLPGFGEQVIPARVRLGVALAFALIVWPALPARTDTAALPVYLASEVAIGLLLGAGLRLMVHALQIAGTIAAQSTSLAQFLGGAGVDPQPAMAQILMLAGIALALLAGLHVRLAEMLILSYDLLPPGRMPSGADVALWGIARIGHSFGLAFSLALPFVILSLLYNLALGVINKAMPQLMVAFVGAPAITLAGLGLLMLTAPLMLPVWHGAFQTLLANPIGPPR